MDKEELDIINFRSEIDSLNPSNKKRLAEQFALAALGSIPWVGGFIGAVLSYKSEEGNIKLNSLQTKWLEEHQKKLENLNITLNVIAQRFESLGDEIDERLESDEYLDLVRKSFRVWNEADTEDKRKLVSNMITNAVSVKLCSDDIIRLFIDWLNNYHEVHFQVMRIIYLEPGVTRHDIWTKLHDSIPREDSAEADLYRMLIRDLSTGGVIRQARNTTEDGRFLKQRQATSLKKTSSTMESAFETNKQYVLTELGKQFVHYTMNEVVTKLD
ncbi:hypothetical protein [Serratia quinivorans]|uniref:hypothetical protein n=1 Tax=Serratia quinivorans TaxID=137545 RepID=UPI00217758E7|nr:hypothetical protein [Serratia quinivorans]CAI1544271.1 Uncharacterised protein [Serratia quinivorans]